MSLISKGTSSLRKKDVIEQKSIALGFKKMVFAHRANAGETGIDLNALVTPPEMSAYGFVNPSVANLTRTNIYANKNNLKIVSSMAGILMPYMTYNVNSSTFISFNGFTAAQDEVFVCYLDEAPTTSLTVVDGQQIIASGTLLAGQTDFNIGTPIEINKYSSAQHGAVMVYADRALQYRKAGNITSGDGDYIEVPVAGGLGSLIRFNASGVDRFITVVSNGIVAERPDGSMMALIERVQGQVDAMIPTLADVAGVDETDFQTAPNNVDLKQFGDTVLNQQAQIDTIEADQDLLENRVYNPMNGFFGRTTGFSINLDAEQSVALTALTPITPVGVTISGNSDFTFARSGLVRFIVTARWRNDVWIKWWLKNLTTNAIVGESVSAGASSVSGNQPGTFEFIARVEAGVTYGLRTSSGSTGAYTVDTPSPTVTFTNFTGRNLAMTVTVVEI